MKPRLLLALILCFATAGAPGARAATSCGGAGDDKCEAWVSTYDDPSHGLDTPMNLGHATQSLLLSPNGRREYVAGSMWGGDPSTGGSQYDYGMIAYDESGARVWLSTYNGPANNADNAWGFGISPDGERLYVTGASYNGPPGYWDIATVAFDAKTGAQLWADRFDASTNDRAWSLVVSPDGERVYVGGESNRNYAAVAYDARTGSRLWSTTYDGPNASYDYAQWIDVGPDGAHVFLTGVSPDALTGQDIATVALNTADGSTTWVARKAGLSNGTDFGYGVKASSDGSTVYVAGHLAQLTWDFVTIAYDAHTGAQRWMSTYDGPGQDLDEALALALSPDGSSVYVTGYGSGIGTSYDYATIAYDASSGAQRWVARYNGPALTNSDLAFAVVASPDGHQVYVTGASPPLSDSDNWDIATLAYDAATGGQLWIARFDGDGFQDQAYAAAVSPDGARLFVNGETWHSSSPGVGDYATLAYDTGIVPVRPIISDPPDNALLNGSVVTVGGTASPGARISIREGGEPIGDAGADGGGMWSASIGFSDGSHTIDAIATDASGQRSAASASRTFSIDSVAPAAPGIDSPSQDAVIKSSNVVIAGTTEADALVALSESGAEIATMRADHSGKWSLARTFTDGGHSISATARDAAGNTGAAAVRTFTVDTVVLPVATIFSPSEGSAVATATVTISGSAPPNSTVTVREASGDVGTTVANAGGGWSVTHAFSEGPYAIDASAIDGAGHHGPVSAPRHFSVDTTRPAAPAIASPHQDDVLGDASVMSWGTAEPGTTVELRESGRTVARSAADTSGAWTAPTPLTNGAHTLVAVAHDAANNASLPSAAVSFEVADHTPPDAPMFVTPAEGASIGNRTVGLGGTAERGTTIGVFEGPTRIAATIASSMGKWSVSVSFQDGSHHLVAVAEDPAGNRSDTSAMRSFTVDANVGAPTITAPTEGSTYARSVMISGVSHPTQSVAIMEGVATLANTTAATDGRWAVTVQLGGGPHIIVARISDAGGTARSSSPRSFTVDASPPSAAFTTRDGSILGPQDTALHGAASDETALSRTEIRIYDMRGVLARTDVVPCAGQEASWSTAGLEPGWYSAQANAIDAVGNRSAVARITFFVV